MGSGTSRWRRVVVAVGASALLVGTAACSSDEPDPAGSGSAATGSTSSAEEAAGAYLALGDSVPFGFRGGAGEDFSDAENFTGYPELVGDELGVEVINASCPGETTASFLDVVARSNGCTNSLQMEGGFRSTFPLHVEYDSADQSQLEFAVRTLQENEDIELVTVQIGANDLFVCQQTTASGCTTLTDLQALGATVQENLRTILAALREEAGYEGQLVVVNYYALNYADAFGAAIGALGAGLAQVAASYDADVADAYAAFRPGAEAAGGDSTAAGLVLPDDIHPTAEGQELLAEAVLAVVE